MNTSNLAAKLPADASKFMLEVVKRYNITQKMNFPDISRFDPVARAIGIRPGDVCHITRPSKTAIEADYYRICS